MSAAISLGRNFSVKVFYTAAIGAGLTVLGAATALADWPDNNTNVAKWYQFPDRTPAGYDILAGTPPPSPNGTGEPVILADDFQCTQSGPITDIHIWGSWFGLTTAAAATGALVPPITFTLGIWTDVPAVTNSAGASPSHPGQLLWIETFQPGQYVSRPVASVPAPGETFWDPDPAPAGTIMGQENIIWQYNFYPTNPFVQTQGTIYWLSLTIGPVPPSGNLTPWFGWKTTATNHWGDDAVFGHIAPTSGEPLGDWQELFDPRATPPRSLDFSFVLTAPEITNSMPPPPPPPTKWVQYPNLNGYDVDATLPEVVADDFLCTSAGTITNIQVWASFFQNQPDPNMTFVVGIWTDVLPNPLAGGYSHPGSLLWTETFAPGGYTFSNFAAGQEQFYNPATGQVSSESQVFLYNFSPQNPFCQQGSPNSPIVYWLSVYALPSVAGTPIQFGWKTSTNHFRDDAVYGTLSAAAVAGNWKELFAPISSALVSLDMAFRLNNGPPDPDCDTGLLPKWKEPPDTSTNGLDVLATAPEIVGDDFLCRTPGPISGITIWGSWLSDLVDTNATFVLRLWSDVPAVPGAGPFSHPGQMLCETEFFSPQTVGTSVQRYHSSLAASNLQENFYKPDLAGLSGFVGTDTQIWRYDFFPFQPSCWVQEGRPAGPGLVYWVTIDYLPPVGTANSPFTFGVKTSTSHLLDDAVYGHLDTTNNPLNDWVDLTDPRTGQSLDLSHELWTFPVHGINKDLYNNTTNVVTGIQIVVAGIHVITWHYDGVPPWPVFQVSYAAGNTVLQWSGMTLPPGGTTHVGFEMAASSNPQILSMNWMSGGSLLLPPVRQGNFHWLNDGTILVLVNDLALIPLQIPSGRIEWYTGPVALDQMNGTTQRTPLASATLQPPQGVCLPGASTLIPVPPAPGNATYQLLVLNLTDPSGEMVTTDYVLDPLDAAQQPQVNAVSSTVDPVLGPSLSLVWSAIPGRIYNVQFTTDFNSPAWTDSGLGDLMAVDSMMNVVLPVASTGQGFYRIYLVPQ